MVVHRSKETWARMKENKTAAGKLVEYNTEIYQKAYSKSVNDLIGQDIYYRLIMMGLYDTAINKMSRLVDTFTKNK